MNYLLKTLDFVAPGIAAKKVHHFISNPRVRKLRTFEEEILDGAKQSRVSFKQFEIQGYFWGREDAPTALLVHGWEGQAGNFGNLVSLLTDKGYRVVAYDGPSHGKSTKHETNMFEYADFIAGKIKEHQPKLMISHSFGTITTLLGLIRNSDFNLHQWIIVTAPYSFKAFVGQIKENMGLSDRTMRKLTHLLEKDTEYSLDELNVATSAQKLNGLGRCTIIHSARDKVIPVEDARKVHKSLPDSELIEPDNLGHYKILWSNELKNIIEERV